MRRRRQEYAVVEMQMGPMIDMVFLLLVFFMVTAKPIDQESDITLTLPGSVNQESVVDIPSEHTITIAANGTPSINAQTVDHFQLQHILTRLKHAADLSKSNLLVTLSPHDEAQHQHIVNVLNVCAEAHIKSVTFSAD